MSTPQPVPFEIVDGVNGTRVATNGAVRLTLHNAPEGKLLRRRGVKGVALRTPAEQLLPRLNELAGELLQQPDMSAEAVRERLLPLLGLVHVEEPQRVEWAVAELDGVRVYTDGVDIFVTREDLTP